MSKTLFTIQHPIRAYRWLRACAAPWPLTKETQ